MEVRIGVEMRDEYRRLEVFRGAMKFMRDFLLAKPGENVVITYDTCVDERVVKALVEATYALDAVPTLIYTPTSKKFFSAATPPKPLCEAIAVADLWVELSYGSIMHSAPYRRAVDENGARYICATGMDVEMLVNLIEKVDLDKVIELGEYFRQKLEAADEIVVTSKSGTHLTARQKGRKIRHSGIKASIKGYPVMMPGQTSWCPIEETINGTLVFDGAVFPPELGILKDQINMELVEGRVTKVYGNGFEAKAYDEWLHGFGDPNMLRLAHYSQGFNPGVTRCTGRIVEDERVFGCMEFGIGSQGIRIGGVSWNAASHTDGILLRPSIYLDGEALEEDGFYVDPVARKLCEELGIEGY